MATTKKPDAARSDPGLIWSLDLTSKRAIRDAIENGDPAYVDMLVQKVSQRLTGAPAARQMNRPSLGSEVSGAGFDLVKWVHDHPWKFLSLGLVLAGGGYVFVKGIQNFFGGK